MTPGVPGSLDTSSSLRLVRALLIVAIVLATADAIVAPLARAAFPSPIVIAGAILALAGLASTLLASIPAAPGSRLRDRSAASDHAVTFAIFTVALVLYGATAAPPTPFNEPVRQAFAFLHGHAFVDAPPYMEHVVVNGRSYLLHPPLSAILLMPAVAIWGLATNQTAVSVVLGAISVALAWRMLTRVGLGLSARLWLTAFFALGTTFWYEATLGNSWDFVLAASIPFTLAALDEIFGSARPIPVAIFAGLAALARYDLVLAWPAYLLMLAARGRSLRDIARTIPVFAAVAIVFVAFNRVRYGTPTDIGLWLWYSHDHYRFSRPGGPFALRDLPFNLYTALFMAPAYTDTFPWIRPKMMGQALILTSPAFLLALRPSFLKPLPILLALAIILTMGPGLTVYANGFAQFGARYWLQVYPFMLALIALGLPDRESPDQLTMILVAASILFAASGMWTVRLLGFG